MEEEYTRLDDLENPGETMEFVEDLDKQVNDALAVLYTTDNPVTGFIKARDMIEYAMDSLMMDNIRHILEAHMLKFAEGKAEGLVRVFNNAIKTE